MDGALGFLESEVGPRSLLGYQVHRRRAGGPGGENGAPPVLVPESRAPEGVPELPEVQAPLPPAAGNHRARRETRESRLAGSVLSEGSPGWFRGCVFF